MKRIGSLGVAFLFLCGCTPNLTEFRSAEGRFSILMPPDPEHKSLDLAGLNVKMYGKDAGSSGAFAVGFADAGNRPLDIGGCAGGVARTHGGTVLFNRPVTHNGLQGREFEVSITQPRSGYCSGRVFIYKKRLYLLLAVGSNYRLNSDGVQKFLESFKIER